MIILKINLQLFAEGEDIGATGEVATPQDGTTDIGTDVGNTSGDGTDTGASGDTGVVADTKPKQSPEVDSAFAEMRRKAEAAEKKVQEFESKRNRDREIARQYANDYGVYSEEDISAKYGESHNIHTVEDLQRAILQQEYAEKGIDPDVINQLIENNPIVQEAKRVKEQTVISNQYNALLEDLKEDGLSDLITKPEDIPDEVYDRWDLGKGNLSLSECFYLAQRKQISAKRTEATKQATLNNISGKQHLKTEGDGIADANDTNIPGEIMDMYAGMGLSKKEAQAHYKKIYGG